MITASRNDDAFGSSPASTPASAAVTATAAALPHASLDEVLGAAELQTRVDRKYLVPVQNFIRLGDELARCYRVLQIDGQRTFGYESVYFDTPELTLYRQHLQGRRRRYKVRTRTYLDTGHTMFEVKLKGLRGQTIKHRRPHPPADRRRVTEEAATFLDQLLQGEYGDVAPELVPSVTTRYSRTTLVDMAAGARVTCDVDLVCSDTTVRRATPGNHVLVETKNDGGAGLADRVLHDLGIRPVGISKYCVGVALLHPRVPSNRWHRILCRHFGYQNTPSPAVC